MHERPDWWGSDDLPRRRGGWADSGRRSEPPEYWDSGEPPQARRRRHYEDDEDDRRERRNWADKAGDEVKSWFGNDRAEARREEDKARTRHERRDYRGVGPRARYHEDEELREEICERLADDPDLDASDILVRVIDNEAILDGAVSSQRDAARAYEIAGDVPGIIHVRERLKAHRGRDERVRNAAIGMGYDEGSRRRGWYG